MLLDNFIAASAQMEQVERETETAQLLRDNKSRNPLEPLLEQAMRTNLFPSSSPPSRSSLTPFLPLLRPEYCVSPSPPALGFPPTPSPLLTFPTPSSPPLPSVSPSPFYIKLTHIHTSHPPTHPGSRLRGCIPIACLARRVVSEPCCCARRIFPIIDEPDISAPKTVRHGVCQRIDG